MSAIKCRPAVDGMRAIAAFSVLVTRKVVFAQNFVWIPALVLFLPSLGCHNSGETDPVPETRIKEGTQRTATGPQSDALQDNKTKPLPTEFPVPTFSKKKFRLESKAISIPLRANAANSAKWGIYHHHPNIFAVSKSGDPTDSSANLFLSWANHPSGEGGPGQKILCCYSPDGKTWAGIETLFPKQDSDEGDSKRPGRTLIPGPIVSVQSGGESIQYVTAVIADITGFSDKDSRYNAEPKSQIKTKEFPKRMRKFNGYLLRRAQFQKGKPDFGEVHILPSTNSSYVPKSGFGEFPRLSSESLENQIRISLFDKLSSGTWHYPAYEDLTHQDGNFMTEPTTIQAKNGMVLRYSRNTGINVPKKVVYQWYDDSKGKWTKGQTSTIPDAPSKTIVSKVDDFYIMVGNHGDGKFRDPLTLSLSKDGWNWLGSTNIRRNSPKFRLPAREPLPDGRGRGFQYPSMARMGKDIFIAYSINKEEVVVTQLDISEIKSTFLDPK